MIRLPALHQHQMCMPPEDCQQKLDPNFKLKEQECVSLLKKCKSLEQLKLAHGRMLKLGLFCNSFYVSNFIETCALSNWGCMDYASSVFSQVDEPIAFQCNTMIRGHAKNYNFLEALALFVRMLEDGILPDNFTYPFVLKACANLKLVNLARQIHGLVYKFGFHDDVFVQNSLINMYGKCGNISDSCTVFDRMELKTVASCSALIAVHANLEMWSKCLEIFADLMEGGNCRAEESTLVSVLCASTHLGALDVGRSIHGYLLRSMSGLNVIVQTTLIDMYIKCGSIEKGLALFNRMSTKNQWSYSVMISGLAMHGYGREALALFSEMLGQGVEPDDAVYLGVLSACRHSHLVKEGLEFFERMKHEHQVQPTIQHYGCVVDLLGQAAMFREAFDLISNIPMASNDVVWRSLLRAAIVHNNLEVGERAAENLMQLDSGNAGDYVMKSNLYARAQQWTDAAAARSVLAERGLHQDAGISLVEVKRKMYSFVSQDKSHHNWKQIYEMIHQMELQLKLEGYAPDISEVLHNVDAEEKRHRLKYHSQKLALAFALLHTQDTPIRIVRNVRMCRDSHTYTNFISLIYNRKITVRDRNQFHYFKDGTCTCRDNW